MTKTLSNIKLFTRNLDESHCLYEYYARANGLHSKSMLILMWIYYSPNGITQNTITKKTYSTKQVVCATIKSFLEKEYIYFEENDKDKRFKKIKLTEKGLMFASNLLDTLEKAETEAINNLTLEQQEKFIKWFQIYNQNFKANIEKLILNKGGKA